MSRLSFSWKGNFLLFAFFLVGSIYLVGTVTLSAVTKLELASNGEKAEGVLEFLNFSSTVRDRIDFLFGLVVFLHAGFRCSKLKTVNPEA